MARTFEITLRVPLTAETAWIEELSRTPGDTQPKPLILVPTCESCGGALAQVRSSLIEPGRRATLLRCRACGDEFVLTLHMAPRRPFALDPALKAVVAQAKPEASDQDGPIGRLADHLVMRWGISHDGARQRAYRWRRNGLTVDDADRLAVSLGKHPSNLWPEWWDVARQLTDA